MLILSSALTREHIEAFITDLLGSPSAGVLPYTRYRALRSFFGRLVEEGEIRGSPMQRTQLPPSAGGAEPRPALCRPAPHHRGLRTRQDFRGATRRGDHPHLFLHRREAWWSCWA